jgi:hypothetical protein
VRRESADALDPGVEGVVVEGASQAEDAVLRLQAEKIRSTRRWEEQEAKVERTAEYHLRRGMAANEPGKRTDDISERIEQRTKTPTTH